MSVIGNFAERQHTKLKKTYTETPLQQGQWSWWQKFIFRIFFISFFILIVPLDLEYYTQWFTTDWSHLHIRDIGKLAGSSFSPIKIIDVQPGAGDLGSIGNAELSLFHIYTKEGSFGLASYINWALAFILGLIGAVIWTFIDRKSTHYRELYYFITVGVSYAMLIRLQGLTFSKVFPTQMPDLALTQLHTPFGDFTHQKLYWIQFSFVQGYEIFAGLAELAIMLLLFFRPTRALGAALSIAMVGNIAIANHLYDGGIHLAASFYALGGAFVLWAYLPHLWRLIVLEKDTTLTIYHYPFKKKWQKITRLAVKTFIFTFFFAGSAYLHWQNYRYDSYKVPQQTGLPQSRGYYDVTEFKLNHQDILYSPVDPHRWQQVTFEKWSTISFTVFDTFDIHGEAGRGKQFADIDRTYESAGTGGGRRHYYYEADTINHILHLHNKNKLYKDEKLTLHYQRPKPDRFILSGKNENGDAIYMVLDKKQTEYPLYEAQKETVVWQYP